MATGKGGKDWGSLIIQKTTSKTYYKGGKHALTAGAVADMDLNVDLHMGFNADFDMIFIWILIWILMWILMWI